MKKYFLICFSLLLFSGLANAIGELSISNNVLPTKKVKWNPGNSTITTSFDLCVVSSVWWVGSGWKPEPFWVEIIPRPASNAYYLGNKKQIPVTFTFLKEGEPEKEVKEGFPSENISGNNRCNGNTGYKLNATMYINGHELYGDTYRGNFTIRLGWSHDRQKARKRFSIELEIPHVAYVSNLKALTLVDSGSGWSDTNGSVCVYSSLRNAKYAVEARTANNFMLKMSNSNTQPIPYTLEWMDTTGKNWNDFKGQNPLTNQRGSSSVQCLDGKFSGVRATAFPNSSSQAGVYQDIVTITVYPK